MFRMRFTGGPEGRVETALPISEEGRGRGGGGRKGGGRGPAQLSA